MDNYMDYNGCFCKSAGLSQWSRAEVIDSFSDYEGSSLCSLCNSSAIWIKVLFLMLLRSYTAKFLDWQLYLNAGLNLKMQLLTVIATWWYNKSVCKNRSVPYVLQTNRLFVGCNFLTAFCIIFTFLYWYLVKSSKWSVILFNLGLDDMTKKKLSWGNYS